MSVAQAIDAGAIGGKLWFYSNYHCNLQCTYCLTESAPKAERRLFDPATMIELADEAKTLGFTSLGVTGGEPFLLPSLPDMLLELAKRLPTLVLTNATLFTKKLLDRMEPLAGNGIALQISLDSSQPVTNDAMRGPENFAKVVDAIPKLVEMGIPVRIATTGTDRDPEDMAQLCALHRSFGISDEDHVLRPIVSRGRAKTNSMGVAASPDDLPPELTVTADGAFWSPFGPTVRGGKLDTDLLLTRTVRPLSVPADAMIGYATGHPGASSATPRIR